MVGRKRQRVAVHRRIVARKQRQERNKHTQAGATQDPNEACPTLVLVLGMTEGLDLQLALEYCLCQWGYEVSADIGKRGSSENASSGVAGPRNDLTSSWYRLVDSVAKDRNSEIRRMHWMCLDAKAPFEAVLDAAKVADLGLLLYVEQRAVEETAEAWLDSIRAQGLMSCIAVAVPPLVRSMTATSDHAMVLESNHSESYLSGGVLALGSVEDSPASRPWLAWCNDRLAAASILDAKEKPIQVRIMRSRGDAEQIRRQLEHAKRRVIRWRADRPYMLVEQVVIESDSDSTECSVRIIGWLRGAGTNARRLVHLTGMGTFVVSRIERAQVPFLGPLFDARRNNSVRMDGIETSELVLDEADDPSEAYATVSGMQIEDTVPADWRDDVSDDGMGPVQTSANAQTKQTPSFGSRSPNEDILVGEAAEEATSAHCPWALPPNRTGIPERALNEMSYEDAGSQRSSLEHPHKQATSWDDTRSSPMSRRGAYMEDDESDTDDPDETGSHASFVDSDSECVDREHTARRQPLSKDRVLHRASSASMSGSDSEVDAPQARSQGALEEVKEIERDELMFPDEVDTPTDCPVRERFAHYRPLPSYRKTPWDSNTSLPPAYARVVQFEHFRRAVRTAHQEAALSPVKPHTYIAFLLKSVPVSVAQRMRGWTGPLIATSLLRYEHLPTVMHCLVQRSVPNLDAVAVTASIPSDQLVRSKQLLTFHIGFRRLLARPIFSEPDSTCDKHRYERYLLPARWSMASLYAPVTYPPAPVLVTLPSTSTRVPDLIQGPTQVSTRPLLVATGSVVGANPDRIVLKRVVLTGVPYRAHKTRATIRYMFFDPEDVKHYKNVPLWTKHGRLGRIEESLGTHGAMKATFDGTILHSDTVCLSLYRRVFPEWVSGSTSDTLDETGISNTVVDR